MTSGILQTGVLLANGKKSMSEVFLWLGVIVALALLLGVVAMWLRKKLLTRDPQVPMGFTLKDLRKLHEMGQLSDEELAAAEEKALARSRSHYLGHKVAPIEEPEDIGHLSTGSEEDLEGGTENNTGVSDKNRGGEPGP